MFDIFPSSQMIFIMGLRKSGTSWVRSILQTHPSIITRLEDNAHEILWSLRTALSSYNRKLREAQWLNDNEDPIHTHSSENYQQMVRFFYETTCLKTIEDGNNAKNKAKANTVVFRDFTVSQYFGLFTQLFPQAKFIYVTRDPRDVAISSWFYHKRVQDGFEEKAGNLQYYARTIARDWIRDYNRIFFHPSINDVSWHIVRFEDLHENFYDTVGQLFSFVGVKKIGEERAAKLQEQTSFTQQTDGRELGQLDESAYFRQGVAGGWKEHLEERTNSIMMATASRHMRSLGYIDENEEYDMQTEVEEDPPLAKKNLKQLATKTNKKVAS